MRKREKTIDQISFSEGISETITFRELILVREKKKINDSGGKKISKMFRFFYIEKKQIFKNSGERKFQ